MPSKTAKQAKFMRAVAHGMKPRGGKGPSKKVAKEFMKADALRKYSHNSPAGWKKKRKYGGSTTGGASIGGGSAGG